MDASRMQEIDVVLAGLYGDQVAVEQRLAGRREQMHVMAGDRRQFTGRGQARTWKMSFGSAMQYCQLQAQAGRQDYQAALDGWTKLIGEQGMIRAARQGLEALYLAAPWSRFFEVANPDGHIHRSMGCSTCWPTTVFTWHPELSGLTVDEAVAQLGPFLCQVCFPAAKAEHKRERREFRQADREARRAARDEQRYVKQLRPEEAFSFDQNGGQGRPFTERVETVAKCKEIIRSEVEFRDYCGRGPHPYHPAYAEAARRCTEILLARDAGHGGMTAEQVTQMVRRAEARERKNGARI